MLTVFATPKPFQGHFATIQRNAITSWACLRPRPEIILFGDAPGTAEICRELGLIHVPAMACNEYGAPLLADLFEQAQRLARHEFLCYANADILFLGDFLSALQRARTFEGKFLLVGRAWRVHIADRWNFDDRGWERRLRDYVLQQGQQNPPPGNSDYFAFPRGLWHRIPPLAIGRGAWDAWLVYEARRLGAALMDASSAILAIHQNHDQSAYPHGLKQWRTEINRNIQIAGKSAATFCLYDATHVLTPSGLRRPFGIPYLVRRVDTLPMFHPVLGAVSHLPRFAIAGARLAKKRWTQARDPLYRLARLIHSKLPADGITAVLGLASGNPAEPAETSRGLRLVTGLLMGGSPVVVYDPEPSVMEQARRLVGGPVEFAGSADECAAHGDVVVIAAPHEEFKQILKEGPATGSSHRTVIDCCALLEQQPSRSGVDYFSWKER